MAKAFANQGANLVLLARRMNLLEENAKAITEEQFRHEMNIDLFGTFVCAREFGKEMIKAKYGRIANSICPGYFYTDLTTETLDSDYFQAIAKRSIPLERYGRSGELDTCALFLASPASTYVTGQNIAVDGGYTCV